MIWHSIDEWTGYWILQETYEVVWMDIIDVIIIICLFILIEMLLFRKSHIKIQVKDEELIHDDSIEE